MVSDQIHSTSFLSPAAATKPKDVDIMALEKDSLSSTPPATHNEHGHHDRHVSIFQAPQDYRPTTVDGVAAYSEHGPLVDHKIPQEDAVQSEPDLAWSRFRHFMREPFAEFMGVFILIMFGDGVVAQVVLSNSTKGDYQSISWGWG